MHVYEVSPRKDRRGFDLMSDTLPFRLWYAEPNAVNNAVDYAEHRSRSHHAVIRVVMTLANVIETHEHTGESKCGKLSVPKTLRHLRLPDPWLSLRLVRRIMGVCK